MKKRFRIKEAARERGFTLSSLARKLGIHRSNMSSIASGARGVSLKVLEKICYILDCSIDELILPEKPPVLFKDKKLQTLLDEVERRNYDGIDKTWVNNIVVAQKMHYKSVKRYNYGKKIL